MKSHTSVEFPACRVECQQTTARGDRGFTLIELLVVIAIIAMLAALVVPAVTRSINRSSSVTSKNNLRQIYVAIQQYASDHEDNKLPGPLWATASAQLTIWNGEPDGNKNQLASVLSPYLGYSPRGNNTFYYPAFDYPAFKLGKRPTAPGYYISRFMNVDGTLYFPVGCMGNSSPGADTTMKLTHVGTIAPAEKPFILETDYELLPDKGFSNLLPLEPVHGDRNALFYGGHVGVTARGKLTDLNF